MKIPTRPSQALILTIFISLLAACSPAAPPAAPPGADPPSSPRDQDRSQATPTPEPTEIPITPEVIERDPAAGGEQLLIRIYSFGNYLEGTVIDFHHRGEIQVEVDPGGGEFDGIGHGVGQALTDQRPYSMDICRYDIAYQIKGELSADQCFLDFDIYEEVLEGTCTHFDPNQSFSYPYAVWGSLDHTGYFYFRGLSGNMVWEETREEIIGKVRWLHDVTLYKIKEIPLCPGVGGEPFMPTPLPWWPTPSWEQ